MKTAETMLDETTFAAIDSLCEDGNVLAEEERFQEAVEKFNDAWELIPEPKSEWEAATWVLSAIGDCCFFLGKLTSARKAFEYATQCPAGMGNAFVHMRLGEVLYEQSELDMAADELLRAYLAGGEEAFKHEDPKYLAFLWTKAKRPTTQ